MRRSFVLSSIVLLAAACQVGCFPGFGPTPTPMPSIDLVRHTPPAPCTAILLPGMLDSAATFKRRGFAQLASRKAPGLDVVAANAHFGYYRKNLILTRLHEDLVGPRIEDDRRVWLVGTSLGGVGSILYARGENGDGRLPDADRLAGIVLLAPFLGDDDLIAEIEAAGGPLEWQNHDPKIQPGGDRKGRAEAGRAAWTWLVDWYRQSGEKPRVVLGWGADDDLAPAARLASQLLPEEDVFERPGGHDWDVWHQLFSEILDAGVFAECSS